MKMKTQRKQKNSSTAFKHTCECLPDGQIEYLSELPQEVNCSGARFWEQIDGKRWRDVTEKVRTRHY